MGVVAVDIDLGKHREGDGVVAGAELLDLAGVAGLLAAELIAGKSQHRKAARGQRLMQRLEALVLRRKTTGARGVDDQQHLALEPVQGNRIAGERRRREIVNASHLFLSVQTYLHESIIFSENRFPL